MMSFRLKIPYPRNRIELCLKAPPGLAGDEAGLGEAVRAAATLLAAAVGFEAAPPGPAVLVTPGAALDEAVAEAVVVREVSGFLVPDTSGLEAAAVLEAAGAAVLGESVVWLLISSFHNWFFRRKKFIILFFCTPHSAVFKFGGLLRLLDINLTKQDKLITASYYIFLSRNERDWTNDLT